MMFWESVKLNSTGSWVRFAIHGVANVSMPDEKGWADRRTSIARPSVRAVTKCSRYQRSLDPLTLPSKIKRFPPISQRDFLGHDFVYFDFPVIEIAEGAFERVNLRK